MKTIVKLRRGYRTSILAGPGDALKSTVLSISSNSLITFSLVALKL